MMTGSPKANKPAKPLKALLVQIEESLNLRNPRLRGGTRFLKKSQKSNHSITKESSR